MRNVFFDTCVYHQPGIDLLLKVVSHDNVLFASEMVGAVNGIDPETGHAYDDTKRYIEASALTDEDRGRSTPAIRSGSILGSRKPSTGPAWHSRDRQKPGSCRLNVLRRSGCRFGVRQCGTIDKPERFPRSKDRGNRSEGLTEKPIIPSQALSS